MPYERFEVDPHDAIAEAVNSYPGKIPALAARLLKTPQVLRNKLSATPGHVLTLDEFSRIIDCLVEVNSPDAFTALHALCWRHGHIATRLPNADKDGGELLAAVVAIFGEEGRLADDIHQALADNRIQDSELMHIEADIKRVIESLAGLLDKVRAKNTADFHSRG